MNEVNVALLIEGAERMVNRHLARLLDNLENAHCPDIYRQAVKTEIQWLRSDLSQLIERGGERHESYR